jgi:hypothetical protein
VLLILETLWFLLFFSFQSAKWSVTGDRTGALIFCEWSTIQCIYLFERIFSFDALVTENCWYFIEFFGPGRVIFLKHFRLSWLQFLRSLNSFELFVLIFHVLNFWTRAISLSLHCVFRGRGVTLFLSFRGFRFSRCRAGEWTNDKIPYHGESAYISHCRDVVHFRDALHSLLHDQILSNVHVSADISK